MRRDNRRKRYLISFIVVILSLYIYYSEDFERVDPVITLEDKIYWNFKSSIAFDILDQSGIKNCKVVLVDNNSSIVLKECNIFKGEKKSVIIDPPTISILKERSNTKLVISVSDNSYWNFLQGNSTIKEIEVVSDVRAPQIRTVHQSDGIRQGSSAVVIYELQDENLDSSYISTGGANFFPSKFYKDGYYISLIAWPVTQKKFKPMIIAVDKAKNISKRGISMFTSRKKFKNSYIVLRDKFINGKITELSDELYPNLEITDDIEKFKLINETQRQKDENLIHEFTSVVDKSLITNVEYKAFKPLKGAAVVASFGDHRYFYKGDKYNIISESYHLGLDLASTKMASIINSNSATVIHDSANGIYGNMPALNHGLGLYSIYGHCSNVLVNNFDKVKVGDSIAQTGMSGLALGDHLHFGVIVQGVEVNPYNWMRQAWIDKNIIDIVKKAKLIIDERSN